MRDIALGIRSEAAARKLLHHLRRGVASGRLICPVSASMFVELMKQPYSPGRRIGTAQLIDQLSLGVSIMPPQMVMGTEIRSFLLRAKGGVELHPMQELVWTKAAYALGDIDPSLKQLPTEQELSIQKAFFVGSRRSATGRAERRAGAEPCYRAEPDRRSVALTSTAAGFPKRAGRRARHVDPSRRADVGKFG